MLPDERTTHNTALTLPKDVEAMVVAPDRDVARASVAFLRDEGIEVRVADDADGAFEEALMHPPDVIVIDAAIAIDGGVDLCGRLKGNVRTHFVPTIMLLAVAGENLRLRLVTAGADAVFWPEVDLAERRARLWALLRTRALFRRLDRKQRHQGTEISERRRWLAYVLHDLQGAVGALRATFDYLARFAPPANDRRRGDFDEALQDGETTFTQLLHSVRTVLDFDRFEAGALAPLPKPVKLSDVARNLVSELKQGLAREADIEVVASADEGLVHLDSVLMRGALVNLILHCVKHGAGRTFVTVANERNRLSVRISRAGLRFPEVDKGRLFEPYSQLSGRPVGYGVGLALARAIVEAHGGEIWIEDGTPVSGAGAFMFTLPSTSSSERRGTPAP